MLLLLLLLLLLEDYFEVMTSEVGQRSRSTFLDVQYPLYVPPKIFFGVGSVAIDQDLSLLDQISLRGGIRHSLTRFLFGVGSLAFTHIQWYLLGQKICCQCRRSLNKVCSCSLSRTMKKCGSRVPPPIPPPLSLSSVRTPTYAVLAVYILWWGGLERG